jgi:ketosteroid isomerase-like protein
MDDFDDDVEAIEAIVSRQFASLNWTNASPADWEAFAADFSPDATLYPAARPARPQTIQAFVERMKGISQTTLRSFHEAVLGTKVHVFGNVAVAIAAAELTENDKDTNRTVEMMLLVKSEGTWRIVCQAWDRATPSNPVPGELLSDDAAGR